MGRYELIRGEQGPAESGSAEPIPDATVPTAGIPTSDGTGESTPVGGTGVMTTNVWDRTGNERASFIVNVPPQSAGRRVLVVTTANTSEADLSRLREEFEMAVADPGHIVMTNFPVTVQEMLLP